MLALSSRVRREAKKENEPSHFSSSISKRLQTASFRQLNDMMYQNPSDAALQHLCKNNQLEPMARKYHEGYREKMSKWPEKPLIHIISWLKSFLAEHEEEEEDDDETKTTRPVLIDMGCGDCELWRSLKDESCSIISVDFAPPPDISLPDVRESAEEYLEEGGLIKSSIKSVGILPTGCASVVVFCLSLMGIDWPNFVKEGYRLVNDMGYIIIAEVSSRESDRTRFLAVLESLGFKLVNEVSLTYLTHGDSSVVCHQAECATYFKVWMFQINKTPMEKKRTIEKGHRGKPKSTEELFYALKPSLLRPCVYRKSTFKMRDKSRPFSRRQPGGKN